MNAARDQRRAAYDVLLEKNTAATIERLRADAAKLNRDKVARDFLNRHPKKKRRPAIP